MESSSPGKWGVYETTGCEWLQSDWREDFLQKLEHIDRCALGDGLFFLFHFLLILIKDHVLIKFEIKMFTSSLSLPVPGVGINVSPFNHNRLLFVFEHSKETVAYSFDLFGFVTPRHTVWLQFCPFSQRSLTANVLIVSSRYAVLTVDSYGPSHFDGRHRRSSCTAILRWWPVGAH